MIRRTYFVIFDQKSFILKKDVSFFITLFIIEKKPHENMFAVSTRMLFIDLYALRLCRR